MKIQARPKTSAAFIVAPYDTHIEEKARRGAKRAENRAREIERRLQREARRG